MLLGIEPEIEKALLLHLIPGKTGLHTFANDTSVLASFCENPDINLSKDKLARMVALFASVQDKIQNNTLLDFKTMPIFWLLPELAYPDKKALIAWAERFQQEFPTFFQHKLSQYFPFGRSATAIALKSVEKLLQNASVPAVCLLSVDTLFNDLLNLSKQKQLIDEESDVGLVPSEGVIFTCVSETKSGEAGLNIELVDNESTITQQRSLGIESMFAKVASYLQTQTPVQFINTFYAPGNGQQNLVKPWADAYSYLSNCVDKSTQVIQPALFTGELGCCTGLYNLIHLYNGYKTEELQGITLQLDISHVLYQASTLFSWKVKD